MLAWVVKGACGCRELRAAAGEGGQALGHNRTRRALLSLGQRWLMAWASGQG